MMNCYMCLSYIVSVLVLCASRKTALENFINKKNIESSRITILTNDWNETNGNTWLEYQYYFKNIDNTSTNLLKFSDTLDDVYFRAHEEEKDCGKQYYWYVQQILNLLNDKQDVLSYENDTEKYTIDLIVCPDQDSKDLQKNYNPLYETFRSRYALIYKKQNKPKDIFVLTFVGTLWLCFLVTLLLLAVCLRVSTVYHSRIYNGCRRWTWVEITLWVIATACQQGFSYTPSRAISRTFFLLGYITAYVLYTAFTAAITSVLVQQETVAINVMDFKIIGYETQYDKVGQYKITSHVNNLSKLFVQIDNGTNIGIGPQILFEQYIASLGSYDQGYKVIILEKSVGEYKSNFWIPKRLPEIGEKVNQKLIKLSESGLLKSIMKKSLINVFSSNTIDGYSSASLEHVKSAIFLFLAGLIFSLLFLIIELGVYGYRHRVTEQT